MSGPRATVLWPRTALARCRGVVLALALLSALVKVLLAFSTRGTADVETFGGFARAVRKWGPVEVYSDPTPALASYNHPPLTGWLLSGLNVLNDHGLSFASAIRLPAIIADIVTAVLVFELVRRRRSVRAATVAGALIACSPVLITISGFHGNTDPVFTMLALLSLYLLVSERSGVLAGISFAGAISVKLVPVVVLPLLLLTAARGGRRRLLGFLGGGAALFVLLWGPVLLHQWPAFQHKVLRYDGWGHPWWGIPGLIRLSGDPHSWVDVLVGPGRYVALALAAVLPLLLAWRRPTSTIPAFGLCLATFLLLSTASAVQYLAWAAASVLLVSVWAGGIYNAAAGVFLVIVYSHWNDAPFWRWDKAFTQPISVPQAILGEVVWGTLLAVVVLGFWTARHAPASPRGETGGHAGTEDRTLTPAPPDHPGRVGVTPV